MEKKKDNKRFKAVMDALSEVFDTGREVSVIKTEIYFKALEKFTIEEVEKAAGILVTTRTTATFPKPGEFLEALHGSKEDQAVRVWEQVDNAMRHHGTYVSIDFGDVKLHRCIDLMGGWVYLGTISEDEWKWKRKEFESAYRCLAETKDGPDHVAGQIELQAIKKLYDIPKPVYVGPPKATLPAKRIKG